MATNNRKTGNTFEADFCEILFGQGWWCHCMTQNKAGQPADVIAVKKGKPFLVDCKVCENDTFPFSRIETNQHTAMRLWKESGNGEGWFALKLSDESVYMIYHSLMIALSLNQSSINRELITHYGISLERWVEKCM